MLIKRHALTIFFACIFFVLIAHIKELSMFKSGSDDGFYSQVDYVSTQIHNGNFTFSPLFLIHVVRLIAVYPFYICHAFELPYFCEAICFLIYMLPLFSSSRRSYLGFLPLIFIFLPIFFSYRTTLGMIGMLFLYICLFYEKKNYQLITSSALLANLSSGMVLSWVIAAIGSSRYLKIHYKRLKPIMIVMIFGFMGSIIHKYHFMFDSVGASINGDAFERSTIYVSLVHQQYPRLVLYLIVVFSLLFILCTILWSRRSPGRRWIFFLGAVPSIFLEGLGLISYLMCIMTFFYNQRLIFEQTRKK